MKAVVLAAGEGTRLRPITLTRPKHLISIGGKPILEHCLGVLKACGIDETIIVVHYMADAIRQHFGDGQQFGLKIQYAEQESPVGTGNAVSTVEPLVKEEFVLVYGDLLFTTEALKKTLDSHYTERPDATMAIVPVEKPENYGIVELENEKYIKRIVEKPSRQEAPTNFANAGIYVFSTDIFEKARAISVSSRGEWEITDAISLSLSEKKRFLAARLSREDWLDIGKPWDLLEANRWILTRTTHKAAGLIENGAHIIGPVTIAETARIRSGAYIQGPAFIDKESDIGPNCYVRPYTSIGRRVRIGNACEVKNSIVMDGVHIGHLSYVGDSIVGEKCNLGAGTIIANYRFDAATVRMVVKDKVVNTEKTKLGVVFGDDVRTGINALFMPGVKVGNNSWVGPNLVVERDLPPNTIALLTQNMERRSKTPS